MRLCSSIWNMCLRRCSIHLLVLDEESRPEPSNGTGGIGEVNEGSDIGFEEEKSESTFVLVDETMEIVGETGDIEEHLIYYICIFWLSDLGIEVND
jgi:hypothetical protein